MKETIEVLPLYHADLFIVKDVGTEEQRENLKKQILHAKENNMGEQGGGNPGCWRSTTIYDKIKLDVTEGATHYHATYVRPSWAKTKKRTTRIEKHIFYRWEK